MKFKPYIIWYVYAGVILSYTCCSSESPVYYNLRKLWNAACFVRWRCIGASSLCTVCTTLNKKKCIASTALNLVVNILNVERCFRVSSGGTTSNASSWQLYCFRGTFAISCCTLFSCTNTFGFTFMYAASQQGSAGDEDLNEWMSELPDCCVGCV